MSGLVDIEVFRGNVETDARLPRDELLDKALARLLDIGNIERAACCCDFGLAKGEI